MALALLGALATVACAQIDPNRPILLNGPDARTSSLPMAQETVQLAAEHGYNGVSLGIGMQRLSSPSSADMTPIRTVTKQAMQLGLKYICWRLDVDIPNNQAWADEYNGGDIWPIATRPPEATWSRIAQIWQAARDASAAEAAAAGKDPSTVLIFVLGNEPGIGGVGGPSLGPWSYSSFFYNLYQSTKDPAWFLIAFPQELLGQPEGYIEPGYWTMMRSIRSLLNLNARTYAVSLEGTESSLPRQVNSIVGPDAEWLYANTSGIGFNVFGTNARPLFDSISESYTRAALTPDLEAINYQQRVDKLFAIVRANPILATKGIAITEFNITTGRVPERADVYPYRQALLKQTMGMPGVDMSMMFSAYADDPAAAGVNLFNRAVVNGQVVITPVGSHAVGPAYLTP